MSNLPPQWVLLWPLLHVADDGNWHDNKQAFKQVFADLGISEEEQKQVYSKTGDRIVENRAQFALNTLRTAGLIERRRGQYRLTLSGRHLMNEYDWKTTSHQVIMHLPTYKNAIKQSQHKHRAKLEQLRSENQDFQTKIDDYVEKYRQNVKDQLLARLQNMKKATDLEPVMLKLLQNMGYQGANSSSAVTPKANDGGIDCIINRDPLGLSKVLVQVKRYASDNIVDRPKIQAFYGALHTTYHMDRGIFITTSDFSESAKEIARQNNIILINGDKLADLMIQYGVMTKVKKTLKLYELE